MAEGARPNLQHRSSNIRILMVAFGSLIALIAIAGYTAARGVNLIYRDSLQLRRAYSGRETQLVAIQSDVYHSAILIRDYLLDPSHLTAESYQESLRATRESITRALDHLDRLSLADEREPLQKLREEIDAYWKTLAPVFSWTPQQKLSLSSLFLRDHIIPRRAAVATMAQSIQALNESNLRSQERNIAERQDHFRRELKTTFVMAGVLALLIAVASLFSLRRLENRAEESRSRIEKAEGDLRRLSQQLVQAQEEERKALSRELHDEVGQMLTGLRLELANLDRLAARDAPASVARKLGEARALAEKTLQAVRQLAMGLRPSMLDDLGLGPAIEWQAREFSRRTGVPVNVEIDGSLDGVPDAHRTCAYRVVQEALTNCARHAHARHIRIALLGGKDVLAVTIQDDGVGFAPGASRGRGLGLIGIEERVHELGGGLEVRSAPGKGAVLSVEVPLLAKEVS